ncbi:MAG: hypothetical protein J7K20_04335 [Thermodesulfobacterium sp.]|nr:hypothetical protein [Thermodesulfobacterium sp.]
MVNLKITFKYSRIYNEIWKEGFLVRNPGESYPSEKKILNYIKKIEKLWREYERKVLTELLNVTHLKWNVRSIYCYVVGRCKPISDPLTVPLYEKHPDFFIDMLIHELIHYLFSQEGNLKKTKKAWDYFQRKYKKESPKTIIHIPLQAIHTHIYLKFFNKRRLKRNVTRDQQFKNYHRAWQIIQKEGYKNIINEVVKRTT